MIKKTLKDDKGMALVVVLLVLLVFTILFAGAVYSSNRNVDGEVDSHDYTAVYYQAESGINCVVDQIFNEADTLLDDENLSMEDFVSQMNQKIVGDDLEIDLSNNSDFNGSIFSNTTKDIDFSNNSSPTSNLYVFPNAEVNIKNNAEFTGAIISKNLNVSNNAKIIFDPSAYTNLPDEFLNPIIESGINPVDSSLTLKEKRQGPVIEE